MYMSQKIFSSPSLGNVKFSYTDANFYKKKKEKKRKKKKYSISEYKDLFKNFYRNKNNNNIKDFHLEINNYYLKCQKNVKNYFSNDKNGLGLKFEGNKKIQNYSLNKFNNIFNKACSAREQILQNKILDYYYPKDNNYKLMGEKMKLTPIPVKKNIFIKNENEKNEYLKAKRSAVCMRRLEYTHGLRKNKSQKFINNSFFNNNYKNEFLDILKGAVLIIEEWWIGVLNKRNLFNENYSKIGENSFVAPTVKDSSLNSIEQNILNNLKCSNENIDNKNTMVDNWISEQAKKIVKQKEKNKKEDNNYNTSNINNKKYINHERNKKINKINESNPIFLKNKGKTNLLFNSNKRYMNVNELPKSKTIKQNDKNVQYPIKIIQNGEIPIEYKNNFHTKYTPSNYLQNYFKDYCLNNNLYKTTSNRSLKSFEFIQNKYQNNNKNKYRTLSSSVNNLDVIIKESELNDEKNESSINLRGRNRNMNMDLSSDIEPIHQDGIIKILNEPDKQSNKYKIKYNIIKNKHKDESNNINIEKSSMDGSVDEIITKKLKEIHEKNDKYTHRILKAYNQVKFFKSYSIEKKTLLSYQQKNNFFQNNPYIK